MGNQFQALTMGSNMQAFYDGMTLIGSFVVMVLLIVAVYLVSRWYAGRMSRSVAGKYIKVIDRISLSPGCALFVVQAGDTFYLLGQGDKNVRLICELTDFDPAMIDTPQGQTTFSQMYRNFLHRAGKSESAKDDGVEK